MAYETIIKKLEGTRPYKGGWVAKCPAHDDGRPSLIVQISTEGNLLLHCYAGCSFAEIVEALGVRQQDCFSELFMPIPPERKIVATYNYTDENGGLLFQKLRYEPKEFSQRRRREDGSWDYTMGDVRRVLYNLPEVMAHKGRALVIVEGEKDADSLIRRGFLATTSPDGSCKWRDEYTQSLEGRHLAVIIPDSDGPGRKHALMVRGAICGTVIRTVILELQDAKDVTEWFQQGHDSLELKGLMGRALRPTITEMLILAELMVPGERKELARCLAST